jgi:hypothetical protein
MGSYDAFDQTDTRRVSRRSLLGAAAGATFLGASERLLPGGQPRGGSARLVQASSAQSSSPSPPPITVTVPPHHTAPGNILLTPFSLEYQSGPMIVDSGGNIIWFQPTQGFTANLQMQTYQGQPVLTWWQGELVLPEGYGLGQGKIVNSSYDEVATVEAGNGLSADLHEFVVSPQDTALVTVYEERSADLSVVGGHANGKLLDSLLQEIDIATGKVLMQWRASKHVSLRESYIAPPHRASTPYDFFHINSIDVDEDDNLLISSRNTWCAYKIDRSTGEIIWRLHGKKSDFSMGAGTRFQLQHHVRHHPGNVVTIFDDGAPQETKRSRGLEIFLDVKKRRTKLLHAYTHHPKIFTANQGSMELLPNGNAFIGWGSVPTFTEYSTEGRVRYEGQLPSEVSSYRAFRSPWPPPPT